METEQCNCEQSKSLQDQITDREEINAVIQARNDELEKELLVMSSNLQDYYMRGFKEGLDINCEAE